MLKTAIIYRVNKFDSHLGVSFQGVDNAQVQEIRFFLLGLKECCWDKTLRMKSQIIQIIISVK